MSHEPVRSGPVDPHDVLDIDRLLDGEERMMRDTVRDFVADAMDAGATAA